MQQNKSLDILCDVDGCLRDMMTPAIQAYKEQYDSKCKLTHKDIVEYDFSEHLMPKIDSMYQFLMTNAEQLFYNAKMYPGAREFMNTLKEEGHRLHIATHQLKGTERFTIDWLTEKRIPYDSIHFSKDKTIVKGDYLIDDCVDNLKNAIKSEHTTPLCLDQPWNQEWEGHRFNNYNQIVKYLQGMHNDK